MTFCTKNLFSRFGVYETPLKPLFFLFFLFFLSLLSLSLFSHPFSLPLSLFSSFFSLPPPLSRSLSSSSHPPFLLSSFILSPSFLSPFFSSSTLFTLSPSFSSPFFPPPSLLLLKIAAHQIAASDLNTVHEHVSHEHANEVCHDYNLKFGDELISLKETFGLCEGKTEQHHYIQVRASRYTCVLGW